MDAIHISRHYRHFIMFVTTIRSSRILSQRSHIFFLESMYSMMLILAETSLFEHCYFDKKINHLIMLIVLLKDIYIDI